MSEHPHLWPPGHGHRALPGVQERGGGLPAQQAAAPEKPGAPLMKQNADKPTNVKLYPTRGKRPGNREPSSRLALLGGTRVGCDGHRDLRGDCGGDGLATVCACTHIFERYT